MRKQVSSDEESYGVQEHYTIQQQTGYSTMQIIHFTIQLLALTHGCLTNSNTDCLPDSSTVQLKDHYCSDFPGKSGVCAVKSKLWLPGFIQAV